MITHQKLAEWRGKELVLPPDTESGRRLAASLTE